MKFNEENLEIEFDGDNTLVIKADLSKVIGPTKSGYQSVAKNVQMIPIMVGGKQFYISVNVWAKARFDGNK